MSSGAIGIGIIGLGFMGKTHAGAYARAAAAGFENRLLAVCDAVPERRSGRVGAVGNLVLGAGEDLLFDPAEVKGYERPEDLLADDRVDLVSVCTPTDTHVELALAALRAGKHVLVEKPVAIAARDAKRLAAAADAAETLCMPAMCMRFWPGWSWVKERIEDASLGAVRSAVFQRLGTRPDWAQFYADVEQSGGALTDLHIHDADFVRWCFGPPVALAASGTLDHCTVMYRFDQGPPHVVAEGGWDHARGFPFRMRFVVVFEQATADFELGRAKPLMLARDGSREPVELPAGDGYDGEVRHLLGAIAEGRSVLAATMDEAAELTALLEAERLALTGESD